jgi:hypothetical protein
MIRHGIASPITATMAALALVESEPNARSTHPTANITAATTHQARTFAAEL